MSNKELRQKIHELAKELSKIAKDSKIREEGEKLHKKLSYLSPKDLLKRFTI